MPWEDPKYKLRQVSSTYAGDHVKELPFHHLPEASTLAILQQLEWG